MARYRKTEVSMWGDAKFARLSKMQPSGKALWIYLLIGPDTCIIPGVIRAGKAGIAESLDWSTDDVMNCFAEIEAAGMARADWLARIVYLPRGIAYNPPENPSVARAWRKEFDTLPECSITTSLGVAVQSLLSTLDEKAISYGKQGGYLAAWNGLSPTRQRSTDGTFAGDDGQPSPHRQPHSVDKGVKHGVDAAPKQDQPHRVDVGVEHSVPHSVDKQNTPAVHEGGLADNSRNEFNHMREDTNKPHGVDDGVAHSDPHYRSSNSNRSSNRNSSKHLLEADASRLGSHRLIADTPPAGGSVKEGVLVSVSETPNPLEKPVEQLVLVPEVPDPLFCEIPLTNKPFVHAVRESKVREYEETYPAIDVKQELRACRQWNIDNPKTRKTANGIGAHINAWLSKAQNRAGGRSLSAPASSFGGAQKIALVASPAFLRFWAAYPPGKGDQREAIEVWAEKYASLSDDEVSAIIKGIEGWSRSEDWVKDGGRFIPGPAKFLREERWKSFPSSRHFGLEDTESAMNEAHYSGLTLREIKAQQARERAQKARSA